MVRYSRVPHAVFRSLSLIFVRLTEAVSSLLVLATNACYKTPAAQRFERPDHAQNVASLCSQASWSMKVAQPSWVSARYHLESVIAQSSNTDSIREIDPHSRFYIRGVTWTFPPGVQTWDMNKKPVERIRLRYLKR